MRELLFSVWTFLSYRGEGEGVEGTNMLFYLLFIDLLALSAAYVCVFFFLPVSGTLAFLPPSHSKKTKTKKKGKRGSFFFSGGFGWEGLFLPGLFFFYFYFCLSTVGEKKKKRRKQGEIYTQQETNKNRSF